MTKRGRLRRVFNRVHQRLINVTMRSKAWQEYNLDLIVFGAAVQPKIEDIPEVEAWIKNREKNCLKRISEEAND